MKKFETKLTRGDVEARYIVTAENKEEAAKKFFAICGEHNLKIKEL
jgi:hypothetical protein